MTTSPTASGRSPLPAAARAPAAFGGAQPVRRVDDDLTVSVAVLGDQPLSFESDHHDVVLRVVDLRRHHVRLDLRQPRYRLPDAEGVRAADVRPAGLVPPAHLAQLRTRGA